MSRRSGVNLYLEPVGETYDGMHCGQTDVGIAQAPLVDEEQPTPIWQVVVQADPGNPDGSYVYVGNETQGCYLALGPADSITIPVNELGKVYVRGSVAGLTVNWIAVI